MDPPAGTSMLPIRMVNDSVMTALRKIIRMIDMSSKKMVKRVGLTGPQLLILREIVNRGEVRSGAIARAVSLSQATVTGILERMENRGMLLRRRSTRDKRRIMVCITERGRRIVESAPHLMQEPFVERFNHLQKWEQTMILNAVRRLAGIMESQKTEPPGRKNCGIADRASGSR